MEDGELLSQMLDDIKRLDSCKTVYEFFASLYHIANIDKYRKHLFRLADTTGKPLYRDKLQPIVVEDSRNAFDFYKRIKHIIKGIKKADNAGLFIIALISKIDRYLAGLEQHQAGILYPSSITKDPIGRIKNPEFYKSTETPFSSSYIITPYITPIYYQWMPNGKLPGRKGNYRSGTLANYFFENHTIINLSGYVGDTEIRFVNREEELLTVLDYFNNSINRLDNLIIALASHDAGYRFNLKKSVNGEKHFIKFLNIKEPDSKAIEANINNIMSDAVRSKADILIFPELTIDSASLSFIEAWLKEHNTYSNIKLVIAGSAHCQESDSRTTNKAVMLDYQGNKLWEHRKKKNFYLKASEMSDEMQKDLKLKDKVDLHERLDTTYPFSLLDTPIGRMATMICLDYLEETLRGIFGHVKCGFLWVPSMTPSAVDFKNDSYSLYAKKYKILSAVCASQSISEIIVSEAPDKSIKNKSFLHVPVKGTGVKPTSGAKGITELDNGLIIYNIREMVK
ncbi:MAG: hypothetical protein HQK95_03800 [Nitrospirae bacterium]|nr:hypothetical protein [Nitrospirota bacterium]